jgi:cation transport regulator ChaC
LTNLGGGGTDPSVSGPGTTDGRSDVPASRWYFGYGSNMDPETFADRRGMRPLEALVAELHGWELCFDLPVGPGERGVANLCRAPGTVTWGVVYHLTDEDCVRLDRTEGVNRGFYARRDVQVCTAAGYLVDAFTYESAIRVPARKPSARYMGLLLRGARHHGLPASWIAHLEGVVLAVDERTAS